MESDCPLAVNIMRNALYVPVSNRSHSRFFFFLIISQFQVQLFVVTNSVVCAYPIVWSQHYILSRSFECHILSPGYLFHQYT